MVIAITFSALQCNVDSGPQTGDPFCDRKVRAVRITLHKADRDPQLCFPIRGHNNQSVRLHCDDDGDDDGSPQINDSSRSHGGH